MEVNELPTSDGYGWWQVLDAQRRGKALADISLASDAALLAHRDVFWGRTADRFYEVIGKMMQVLATYNNNVSLPELSAVDMATPPSANIRVDGLVALCGAPLKPRPDVWRMAVLLMRVLLGRAYVPPDRVFVKVWTRLVEAPADMALCDALGVVLDEVRMLPQHSPLWSKAVNVEVQQPLLLRTRSLVAFDITQPDPAMGAQDGLFLVRRREGGDLRHYVRLSLPFAAVQGRTFIKATLPMDAAQRVINWQDRGTPVASRLPTYLSDNAAPFQYLLQGLLQRQSLGGAVLTVKGFVPTATNRLFTSFLFPTGIPTGTAVAANCPADKVLLPMLLKVLAVRDAAAATEGTDHVLRLTLEVADAQPNSSGVLKLTDFSPISSTLSADVIYASRYEDHVVSFDMELDDGILVNPSLL